MTTGTLIPHAVSARGTARFIASIPGDPRHALVSISSWDAAGSQRDLSQAERIDLQNGNLKPIIAAPGRGMSFVADHQGHIRFAYGEEDAGDIKVYLHPVDGEGWQEMPDVEPTRSIPLAFNRTDSLVYFTCTPKDGGFGICSWSPTTKQWDTVWSNPRVEASGLLQGMARDEIAGVRYEDGRPGVALFDGDSDYANILIGLMKQFPGEDVRFVSGSSDGRLSIVRVDADMDPGTFYLYERDTRKLTSLLAVASWIDPQQMAAKQAFDFKARDGLPLQGYVSYPPGEEEATHLPMVVYVHGGPYGVRDDWDYDAYVQALATRGYAVLQVNYRGSGGYGYEFETAGWREWGGKMQDDVSDATRWAIAQGIADPRRICIFGASYGGYAALEGAVKEPDLYQCAIGYVGIYDLPLMYRRGDIPQSTYGEGYLKRVLSTDMQALAQRSPINQLDRLRAKVMLVVGGQDERVPPIQGRHLHDALLKRHIAHAWIDKPGEMHGFYDEKDVAALYDQIVQFLGANIGPGTSAAASAAAH
ncbi:alpha/beta fold hydrolase [Rhodanobacter sp. B05]|uniref:alpha/beta hydrolase family protein n=1 Tax=Rhodanobacter sp. B05 TaxID=1945859 RepID=UPI0020C32F67|nr:alpha/beta fold hydrolase [Rhodanobacter sp. B05]